MCAAFRILRRREEGLQQSKSECVFSLPHSSPWLPNIIRVSLKLQDLLENVIIYLPTLPNSLPAHPLAHIKLFFLEEKTVMSQAGVRQRRRAPKSKLPKKAPETFRRASAGQHRQRRVAGIVHRHVRGEYQRSSNPTGTYSWKCGEQQRRGREGPGAARREASSG